MCFSDICGTCEESYTALILMYCIVKLSFQMMKTTCGVVKFTWDINVELLLTCNIMILARVLMAFTCVILTRAIVLFTCVLVSL